MSRLQAMSVPADDPEAVHDTRVAVRRIRSVLRVFGPVPAVDRALREYGASLGPVRDAEVLRQLLLPGSPVVMAAVGKRLDVAWADLEHVEAPDVDLADWQPELGRSAVADADRVARKRLRKADDCPERLHRARKAAKRARYAAEAVGDAGLARRHKLVQERLGEARDGLLAEAFLQEIGASPAADPGR